MGNRNHRWERTWPTVPLDAEEIVVALNESIEQDKIKWEAKAAEISANGGFAFPFCRRVWSNSYRMNGCNIVAVERRDRFLHPEYGMLEVSYWGPQDKENEIRARPHCLRTHGQPGQSTRRASTPAR